MKETKSLKLAKNFLGKMVDVTIDRPIGSVHPNYPDMIYQANYGNIKGVKAPDGEDLDAYVLGVDEPLSEFNGECIAIVHRLNNDDDKLVVVPKGTEMSDKDIEKAVEFQEKYFEFKIVR